MTGIGIHKGQDCHYAHYEWRASNTCSKLLYSLCLSGDGNFHLQSRLLVKNLAQDPSFFGDSGFFAPYESYHNYLNAAPNVQGSNKASSINLPHIA